MFIQGVLLYNTEKNREELMNQEEKKTKVSFHIIAIICIVLFCFAISPVTMQNDTYYTIKIGEWIVQNGIDMQDHFSWHEDLPYTYPHWAYDTGMYLIYHLGELTGIENGGMLFIYLFTCIFASILGILIYYTARKLTKNNVISFLLTLAVIYLLKDFIVARAQLVSYIIFVLEVLFIENFLQTKKKRYLVGLVILSIILANIHVAVWPFFFVVFLPYIAEYVIASLSDMHLIVKARTTFYTVLLKIQQKQKNMLEKQGKSTDSIDSKIQKTEQELQLQKEEKKTAEEKTTYLREHPFKIKITKNKVIKWLVLIMIICAFTGLLTPIGDTPYTYLIKTMQGNTTESISEHIPLTLYNDKPTMVVLTLFLIILIFTDTKIKLSDLFMLAGLVFMAFMSRRQISLLVLIGGFIFAKLVNALAEKYDPDGCAELTRLMTTWAGRLVTILIVCIFSLSLFMPKRNNKFVNTASYPVEAADWILANLDIDNMRLYNEYNYGSYLIFRGIPVFIDSRADLYTPEFNGTKNEDGEYEGRDIFSDYMNISSIGTYYEDKFEKYNITHVIVVKNAKLNMFLSRNEDYKELYEDNNFIIYERETAI